MSESPIYRQLKHILAGVPGKDGETRAYCPVCENPRTSKSPSASINFLTGQWHCMSCDKGGASLRAVSRILKARGDNPSKPTPEKAEPSKPLPTEKQLRLWHKNMMSRPQIKQKMNDDRGLTDDTLRKYMIGYDGQRYTIPIYDEHGKLVNVRRYKANARDHNMKMISYAAGHGEARIDGFDTLSTSDTVLLTEGELDRRICRQEGLPAVGHTGGAATFKLEWVKHFRGKDVYVGYDDDVKGDKGADTVAKALKGEARSVWRVTLDTGINGGDWTDFFVKLGRTVDDAWARIKDAKPLYQSEEEHVVPDTGKQISVEESKNPDHKEPVQLTAMVSGILDPPYYAPKKVMGTCTQAAGVKCNGCPFTIHDGKREINIPKDDPSLLKFLDAGDVRKKDLLVQLTEAHCKTHVSFEEMETWPVEVMSITPSVAHRSEKAEPPTSRLVYNVGTYRTPVNHLASIVGRTLPDPRSQRALFMGWKLDQVETDLETFKMTPAVMKRLLRFRPSQGQTPLEKCMEIADDLSANVTHIYGRPLLHVGYDLVWHSLTSFVFEDKPITKGWLDCLVIGDTRTGKSETAGALIRHYNAGVLHSLESTSYAGLIGGATQAGNNQWMVTWGLVPLNDRRLLVLDEMSGMFTSNRGESKGIIEGMSSVRSEGKAQVNKIASGEASARTRLIWISNPLSAHSLSESADGCLRALRELVRNPEDIARYDFVMGAASNEVPSASINSTKHRRVRHRYTSQACSELVMWAWSRRADQVKFFAGVEEYIYAAAEDLGTRYVSDPPLIQIANVRVKIARLAVAMAARTFSSDSKGERVLVKRSHVKSAVEFLDAVYAQRSMGYLRHSAKEMESRRRAEQAKQELRKFLNKSPETVDVLMQVGGGEFRPRDFEEFGGMDQDEVKELVARLLRWQMIRRRGKGYMVMQPALTEVLRDLEDEGA